MNLSAETWLMLLALGLYLWDSALLLGTDETVLVQRRGGWRPAFGANGWKLAGREPFVPNPLTPWRGLVKLRWSVEDVLEQRPVARTPRLPAIGLAPRVAVTLLLLLIFVALPACLFVYPVLVVTLPVVAMIYLTCGLTLLALRRDWPALGLPSAAFWKLAGECITRPPFCINAVRKACLKSPVQVELAEVVTTEDREAVHRQVALRVREQIEVAEEGSERMARLQAAARALEPREPA